MCLNNSLAEELNASSPQIERTACGGPAPRSAPPSPRQCRATKLETSAPSGSGARHVIQSREARAKLFRAAKNNGREIRQAGRNISAISQS